MSYNLTLRAKEDLRSLYNYSVAMWSDNQADQYLMDVYDCFDTLANNPNLGKHRGDIKVGYYSFLKGSHVIFYIQNNGDIDIIGVPHQSMDTAKYFQP